MYLALNEYCMGLTNIGYSNKINPAHANDHQLSATRNKKTNTGTITSNLSMFSTVFSGIDILLAARSSTAIRSVTDNDSNPGICFVDEYIFKHASNFCC